MDLNINYININIKLTRKNYININTELNIYQIIEYCYNRLAILCINLVFAVLSLIHIFALLRYERLNLNKLQLLRTDLLFT